MPLTGVGSATAPRTEAPVDSSTPIFALRRSFAELQHGVLGLARSTGRLGISVYAVRGSAREPATSSRYLRGGFELQAGASDEHLLAALRRFGGGLGRRCVLLALDDASAVFVADHHELLDEPFVIPKAAPGMHRRLVNKRQLWQLCQRLGLACPASSFPTSEDQARELSRAYGYPVVLKQSAPWLESRDSHAPTVLIVRSRDELVAGYRRMESHHEPNVIVQEYIPGGSETVWMFNGYFARGSECLCAFTGRKLRQRGPRTGPTTLGVCAWNESVASAAKLLMSEIDYHGIVDMGFRYDHRDGQYKLLDVNPRLGSSFRLFVGDNGIDVVRAAYLDLTGQPVPHSRARDGRKWLVEPYDLVTSGQVAAQGALSLKAWRRSLRGIEEAAWWARDDPLPFLTMCASLGPHGLSYRGRQRRERRMAPAPARVIPSHELVA